MTVCETMAGQNSETLSARPARNNPRVESSSALTSRVARSGAGIFLLLLLAIPCHAQRIHSYGVLRGSPAPYGYLPQPAQEELPAYKRDATWQSLERQRIALFDGANRNRLEFNLLSNRTDLSPAEESRLETLRFYLRNQAASIDSIIRRQASIRARYELRDLASTPKPIAVR